MWQQKSRSCSPLKFLDSLKSLWGNLKSFPLSESSVNRSKIYLSFQNKHPILLDDFMQIRLPSPCFSALSPEPLEIQTLRGNLPTYSKPGPGWQEVVNCYWMSGQRFPGGGWHMVVPWPMCHLEILCCAGASPRSNGWEDANTSLSANAVVPRKESRSETKPSGADGRKNSHFSSSPPNPLFTVKYKPKCP